MSTLNSTDASHGIGLTVTAVARGSIPTDMLSCSSGRVPGGIRAQVPLGRLGRPEEIARAGCFRAADESAYITGQNLGRRRRTGHVRTRS